MENGMVSVIMATYNCADTLPEAIDSILTQTYQNLQFIICDDCSTDHTYSLLQAYAKKDRRILLIKNEKNSKLSFSLNHCLQYVAGDYIARMDGDDISVPDRFEKQIRFLQEHTEYDLVGSAMQWFDENGAANIIVKPETMDKYYMRRGVPFNHATIMTYPRVYETLNGYTVSKRTMRSQDYDLWFRFFHAGFRGYNIQESLYLVREDMNAIKRRTFQVRWNAFQTTRIGFRLLGFPKRWLVPSFVKMMLKSAVPFRVIARYRKYQKKHMK